MYTRKVMAYMWDTGVLFGGGEKGGICSPLVCLPILKMCKALCLWYNLNHIDPFGFLAPPYFLDLHFALPLSPLSKCPNTAVLLLLLGCECCFCRWSAAYAQELVRSRVEPTRLLAKCIAADPVRSWISCSATSKREQEGGREGGILTQCVSVWCLCLDCSAHFRCLSTVRRRQRGVHRVQRGATSRPPPVSAGQAVGGGCCPARGLPHPPCHCPCQPGAGAVGGHG